MATRLNQRAMQQMIEDAVKELTARIQEMFVLRSTGEEHYFEFVMAEKEASNTEDQGNKEALNSGIRPDISIGFPPGINSLEEWGETVVTFGIKKDLNYAELLADEHIGYRKFVMAQKDPNAKLRDLKNFFERAGCWQKLPESDPIPGTTTPRRRRKAPCNSSSASLPSSCIEGREVGV